MAQHGGAMGEGKSGGACAHHRQAFAAGRGARERMRAARGDQMFHRVTLQLADLDRRLAARIHHADLLAEDFGRAGAAAGAAHDVGRQDGARRTFQVAAADAVNKAGNVDGGGAGLHTGRVVAIKTARRFDDRLSGREGGMQVGEVRLDLLRCQRRPLRQMRTAGHNAFCDLSFCLLSTVNRRRQAGAIQILLLVRSGGHRLNCPVK
jgi:hypothetical protein